MKIITIDSISSMLSVLANAEYIDLKPVVTSNLEGIIDERNTNFEFAYQRKNSEGEWEEVANTKDLHMLAALESGRHAFLFSVTDKRTEVKTLNCFMSMQRPLPRRDGCCFAMKDRKNGCV